MASIAPTAKFQGLDANGDPVSGGLLYTYESGTSTPKDTYTSQTAAVANSNPVVLNSGGFADVWLESGSQYRFTLQTSSSTAVWGPIDNIMGNESTTVRVQKFFAGTDYTAGTTTQLTLSYAPLAENNTLIFIDGTYQDKSQYSISSSTVTFTAAIPTASAAVEVIYTVNQASTTYLTPADIGTTVGYVHIPVTSVSAHYTTVLGNQAGALVHPADDNSARTFTIADNSSVAYAVGTCISFVNMTSTITISTVSDTLNLAGGLSTGPRTLSAVGNATAMKIASTSWVVSGTNLT